MKYFNLRTASWIKQIQILLNFAILLVVSSAFLYATTYICSSGIQRQFIEQLSVIPYNPTTRFLSVTSLYLVLICLIRFPMFDSLKQQNAWFFWLECFVCLAIVMLTNGSYNGILLLALSEQLFYSKRIKNWAYIIVIYLALFFLTNFSVVSLFVPMTSIETYVSFLPHMTQRMILMQKYMFELLNFVLFGVYALCLLLTKEKEREETEKELKRLEQVNVQLGHYVTLSQKMAEDNERKRISREIHDTLGHALTGILAGVDACQVLIDLDIEKTKKQLAVVSDVVRQGIKDVRGALNKMRPGALEENPLKESLAKMIHEFEEISNIEILFYYEWEKADFDKASEDIIYRIVQESITNALRHGKATKVEVNLFDDAYKYIITIQDNGPGCEEIKYGFGLKQMQERVAILNGTVQFYGDNGFLTVVEIRKVGNL
ncbi:MAG: sensor histidine kinase [Firmicutes bacterium]|nr:sensor histidine kinase [Bacillota bacterium]